MLKLRHRIIKIFLFSLTKATLIPVIWQMKTILLCIGLLLINLCSSFSCFGGSLIVENEYPALRAMVGPIDGCSSGSATGKSLHIKSKTFQYTGTILIYYAPNGDSFQSFTINDKDRFLVIDLENYFENPGHHVYNSVSIEVEAGILELDLEVDVTHCDDTDKCFIVEKGIQEFHCKVTRAALNGIELTKEIPSENAHKENSDSVWAAFMESLHKNDGGKPVRRR